MFASHPREESNMQNRRPACCGIQKETSQYREHQLLALSGAAQEDEAAAHRLHEARRKCGNVSGVRPTYHQLHGRH